MIWAICVLVGMLITAGVWLLALLCDNDRLSKKQMARKGDEIVIDAQVHADSLWGEAKFELRDISKPGGLTWMVCGFHGDYAVYIAVDPSGHLVSAKRGGKADFLR